MNDYAIRLHRSGGPEVLQIEPVTLGEPGPGQVCIRHAAVGLNFIDIYQRSGLYPLEFPSGLGLEASGVIEALGPGVDDLAVGDRVAYAGGPPGAYCSARIMPAAPLVRLPDALDVELAAGLMLKGLTAQYLLRRTYRVQAGDAILVHAAAGGVGLLLCQWARALGATVIGTTGSQAKADVARANGAHHVLATDSPDLAQQVRALTGGEGVAVVYDSVGKDTFMASLASLRPLGMMVSFGNASGAVPPFDPGLLARMGSLFLTRPSLFHYTARRADLLHMAAEVFAALQGGHIRINLHQRHALHDVALAHQALEARRTTGCSVLLP